MVKVLGIETSCDETAAAVVEGGKHILSSIVASQVELHARYGGIVPEVASRQHVLTILPVLERALGEAGVGLEGVEAIAVTSGPGLPGSLLVGMSLAKALALARRLPLVGVNHLEAHLYSLWLAGNPPPLPALALLVSGGHTELVLMRDHGDIQPLGRTRDDAAGEALDKAARLLGLPNVRTESVKGKIIPSLMGMIGTILCMLTNVLALYHNICQKVKRLI